MLTCAPTAEDEPFMLALYTTSRDYEMVLLPWDETQNTLFGDAIPPATPRYQIQYPQASGKLWNGRGKLWGG